MTDKRGSVRDRERERWQMALTSRPHEPQSVHARVRLQTAEKLPFSSTAMALRFFSFTPLQRHTIIDDLLTQTLLIMIISVKPKTTCNEDPLVVNKSYYPSVLCLIRRMG